ncbi:MAG: hypothetical protein CSB16_01320 [Clostridiales bacterium]|nr:MAG: hypothetical protein CSB16_01320 [Clostridiales bacterium]
MKREIDILEYTSEIIGKLKTGILVTSKAFDKVNTMTIAWGSIGIEWNKPVFITYVREGRFTRELLDENPEFTVNVPYGDSDNKILKFCGSNSGRNIDKIKELGLTLIDSDIVSVPGIKELPLTLECKIIHKKLQDKNTIPKSIKERFYPENIDSSFPGSNRDYHIAYYGEIVKAYIYE